MSVLRGCLKINGNRMKYSIIIPAYNEAAELPATLAAIRHAMQAVDLSGEIIVVDNNSTDATAEIATREGADQVVFEPVNQISRARNAGAKCARGKWFIFIDADTRIQPELLKTALTRLDSGELCGGGALVRFEGNVSKVGRMGIFIWEHISRLTRTAAGSFLFCPREGYEAAGGFDEKVYASEEVWFSRALKRWGKTKRLRFEILEPPVLTSARKLQWYSGARVLAWVLLLFIMPWAIRSRRLCGFWYDRPDTSL